MRRSLAIMVAIIVALALVAFIGQREAGGRPMIEAARAYVTSSLNGDFHAAYDALCTAARARWTEPQFAVEVQRQLRNVGNLNFSRALRGAPRAVTYLIAEETPTDPRRTVADLPMEEVAGRWFACPATAPLGEVRRV